LDEIKKSWKRTPFPALKNKEAHYFISSGRTQLIFFFKTRKPKMQYQKFLERKKKLLSGTNLIHSQTLINRLFENRQHSLYLSDAKSDQTSKVFKKSFRCVFQKISLIMEMNVEELYIWDEILINGKKKLFLRPPSIFTKKHF